MKAPGHVTFEMTEAAAPSGSEMSADSFDARVTVIVTNHNYGHFLRDCLESVLQQTSPVDQLIVVDDGSDDGSAAVLEAYADRAEIIRTENRGQAGAFNLGFRRATGDIVLFLDADDLLRHEALDVVRGHYTRDISLLFFGLEIIDASGRSTGVHAYSIDGEDGDNRPRLLRSGSVGAGFSFAPTSGNAFGRAFLTWALPMPEADWRICADAYLVRAAALHGRIRAVRRVLGAYRVHGGNNYFKADTFDAWSIERRSRDVDLSANALMYLAESLYHHAGAADAELVRLALRLRALEIHRVMAANSGEHRNLRTCVRRAVSSTLRGGLPLRDRLSAAVLLASGQRSSALPAPIESALRRMEAKLAALERPRWLEPLPYDVTLRFDEAGIQRNLLADGWMSGNVCASRGSEAALEFLLEPVAGPVSIEIGIFVPEQWQSGGLRFVVAAPPLRLWTGQIAVRDSIRFTIDRDDFRPEQPLRLEISCMPTSPSGRDPRSRTPRTFVLEHIRASPRPASVAFPFLQPGAVSRPADLVPGDPDSSVEADGNAIMAGEEAALRLSLGPGPELLDLILGLREPMPKGWLRIWCNGTEVYFGATGASPILQVPLPLKGRQTANEIGLRFAFSPAEPASGDALGLTSVGVVERTWFRDPNYNLTYRAPARQVLNVGEVVHPRDGGERVLLETGWHRSGDGGIRNVAAEASLKFFLPPGVRNPSLRIGLRPVLPPIEAHRHLIGISEQAGMLKVVELLGDGAVDVPLRERGPGEDVSVTLHSILAPLSEASADPAPELAPATFELVSLGVIGEVTPGSGPVADSEERYPKPAFLDLIDEIASPSGAPEDLTALIRRRSALSKALWASDIRARELLVARPDRLRAVASLGAATSGVGLRAADQAIADQVRAATVTEPRDRFAALVMAMLLLPAFKLPFAPELPKLPAILVRNPDLVADYLGQEPEFAEIGQVTEYVQYLERLLASIEDILDRQVPGCALYTLAVRVLAGLKCGKAIFGRDNLLGLNRRRGRCIEKLLSRAGAQLTLPARPRSGASRLRVGVLARHLAPSPEAWALLGMYRCLDPKRFDLTLITTDNPEEETPTGGMFTRRLDLAGLSVDEAVSAVRGLDLDLFILGAYFTKWQRLSAIAAHRLARIQINSCFNCPTTLGFRSFDYALAWQGIDARDPQGQYCERLITIEAPMQCCFDFVGLPVTAGRPVAEIRRSIGAREDAVLLTCGAMAHKILPDLMTAWANILARTEGTQLVLYPFAKCWSVSYSAEVFVRRLARCLEAAGVAADRVLVLEEQSHEQVRDILSVSDIYLDSFPYTGATTVCEAFACGLPVISLAGEMLREQTGAAWVRAYGLTELVASSPAEYVDIAVRLASNRDERVAAASQVVRRQVGGRPPHADSERFGAALSDALWKVASESGHFPGLTAPPLEQQAVPAGQPSLAAKSPAMPARQDIVATPGPSPSPLSRKQVAPVQVVILTTPRTGSTMLCQLLGRRERAEMHFELFHDAEVQYRSGPVSDPELLKQRNAQPVAFMESIFADARRSGADLVGFKLFAFHDRRVLRRLAQDRQTRIICLSRSNVLAQYSSRRIAEATGVWQLEAGASPEQVRIRFDPADFEVFEQWLSQMASEVAALLAEAGREALFIEYKSLQQDAGVERISKFLGLSIPGAKDLPIGRQNTRRTIDRFENPDEVLQYLDLRKRASWAYGG